MSKKGTSFKLDPRHIEILDTNAKQLEISKSEYLRNLIDAVQKTSLNSKTEDLAIETKNARVHFFNETTLTVANALTREFDLIKNKKKPLRSIPRFAAKYDLNLTLVKGVLNQLVKNNILVIESESQKTSYRWTYMGVAALPEYAPIDTDNKSLIRGSTLGALSGMLGDYDDVVDHLSTVLNIEKEKADLLVRFFLQNYVSYFSWLREVIYPITGVNEKLDHGYYRTQMIDFLLTLISNNDYIWNDWKSEQVLDLKEIFKKILDYKKLESELT